MLNLFITLLFSNCMKTVMCSGTFDIVHQGHLYYFSESRKYGDRLVVVVARDSTSEKIKGKKPVNNERKRLDSVRTLSLVDKAVLGREGDIFEILNEIKPDVICLGYDQKILKDEVEEGLKKRNLKSEVVRIDSYLPDVYKSSKFTNML